MTTHHIVVTGTGRAGTTFLMQLFTQLGLDTGFSDPWSDVSAISNAGLERDIFDPKAPYFIKSPWICDHLDDVVACGRIVVDHAIVPVRDLYAAAESRRSVSRRAGKLARYRRVRGGLWLTKKPGEQEAVLTSQLYNLIAAIAKHDIPMTLLSFPRSVIDAEYVFAKLEPLPLGVSREAFLAAFAAVSRPGAVNDFSRQETPEARK